VIDIDSDKKLTRSEFRQKTKSLHMNLTDDEQNALQDQLDPKNKGFVVY